jgi:uncharacterized membrane protein
MFALAVAYPVLAHWAVMSRSVLLTEVSAAVLVLLVLLPRLVARSVVAWCVLPFAVAGLFLLARANVAWLPLYAAPVLINLFVAWVFGHTLAAGRVPLIERFARLMHEPDGVSDEIVRYARGVTLAWTVFLIGLALLSLTLALLAEPDGILLVMGVRPPVTVPLEVWSLFANFLNYVIAGAFFLVEYVYRQYRFPDQPYRNIVDFFMKARRVGPRLMGRSGS